jgi:colanic acid/amylovoran biosynthesis glycosyltransferase
LIDTIKYRTNEWWQPKAGLILAAVYLAVLIFDVPLLTTIQYFIPAVITILGIGVFGHLVNDCFDIKADVKAGKPNKLANASTLNLLLYFTGALLLALLPWLLLPFTTFSVGLLMAEFTLLMMYALPVIRLKERGFLALITDALYAYVVPAFLAFYTFSLLGNAHFNSIPLAVAAFLWLVVAGIYNLAIHQLEDFDNDVRTSTKTWATNIGKQKAHHFTLRVLWSLKLVFFLAFSVILLIYNHWVGSLLLAAIGIKIYQLFGGKGFSAHYRNKNIVYLQTINFHYHRWLPYLILVLLSITNFLFAVILILHYLLFNYRDIVWFYKKFIHNHIRRVLSVTVNYAVFYVRIMVLRETTEKARREHQEEYVKALQDKKLRKQQPNMVVANQNKNKYTETFVQQHLRYLKEDFYVHYLYGGNLPFIHEKWGSLIGNELKMAFLNLYALFFDKNPQCFKKDAFKEFLVDNDIKLVLAEFGTVGVEIYGMCKEADVPLIVVFYGYDAHHVAFSPKNDTRYQGLFQYASKIICVSKDIQQTLDNYGAPSEKLVYLPCAFDMDRYIYTDHSKNKPVFLSVGRFAETKSPHLTILAFNEVLKEIPNARLRMIGKDGGGDLFETCHILVKALKIEDKVDFLGILSPEQVYEEMKNARVFVQHSVTTPINEDKEGTPVSVMEAMACGLPVVATRHAGMAELIVSGENGILVEEYDYRTMAEAMVKVCLSDEMVYEYGKNASKAMRTNERIVENKKNLNSIITMFLENH